MSTVLVTIPARKGSKGVKMKNLKHLSGKRLIDWTVDLSLEMEFDICITTDIINYDPPEASNVLLVRRKPSLCQDYALAHDVWKNAYYESKRHFNHDWDVHVYLEPTCPLRTKEDVFECISAIRNGESSVFTVSKSPVMFERMFCLNEDKSIATPMLTNSVYNNTPRQQLKGNEYYVKNGACYARTQSHLIQSPRMLDFGSKAIVIDRPLVNIDEPIDFLIAESIIQYNFHKDKMYTGLLGSNNEK